MHEERVVGEFLVRLPNSSSFLAKWLPVILAQRHNLDQSLEKGD
jgi:hypothetical protein